MRVIVGRLEYVRRDYTPKRRGQKAGHGWIRQEPRAEVGMEAKILIDEMTTTEEPGRIDTTTEDERTS